MLRSFYSTRIGGHQRGDRGDLGGGGCGDGGGDPAVGPSPPGRRSVGRGEELLGLAQVRHIEAFGERAKGLGDEHAGRLATALVVPQAAQAQGGAQLEAPGALAAGDLGGPLEAGLGRQSWSLAAVSTVAGQLQLATQTMNLRFPEAFLLDRKSTRLNS